MSDTVRFIFVVLHIFAAIVWVGGAMFLALVLVPVSRGVQPPVAGRQFLRLAATRFRGVAWVLLATLVVTGIIVMEGRDIGFSRWDDPGFFATETGRTLLIKMALVLVLLALSAIHDYVLGPRVTALMDAAAPGQPPGMQAVRLRKRLIMLARLNMLVALAIVVLGIMLVRGVPWRA